MRTEKVHKMMDWKKTLAHSRIETSYQTIKFVQNLIYIHVKTIIRDIKNIIFTIDILYLPYRYYKSS